MATIEQHVPGEKRFPWVIRTGIPSIDGMFRISEHQVHGNARGGIALPDLGATTSMTIVGPQGTGKSVLAMHIAARYLADCHAAFGAGPHSMPRVCYISTDMTYPVADPMLRRFALDRPNARRVPFTDYGVPMDEEGRLRTPEWLRQHLDPGRDTFPREMKIGLIKCPADDPEALADYLMRGSAGSGGPDSGPAERAAGEDGGGADAPHVAHMAFVDLAARTAGDDWAFVHRLLGVLAVPDPGAPRHMVVIDAIEGLETFGGQLDAYGEPGLRRTRVAKLIRLAAEKCHLVVLVEEAKEDMVLPEEFVSDVVFRLRSVDAYGYLRRTFQIEKARGQSTVRGRHPYVIRTGRGSTTGNAENYDDPRVVTDTEPEEYQSYIEVFPSLHYASRTLMDPRVVEPDAPRRPSRDERLLERAGFGIEYLDEMLAEAGKDSREGSDPRGVPCSSVTGLIGDAGTHKTGLGIAFLGQAFGRMVEQLLWDWDEGSLDAYADADPDTCSRVLEERYARLAGVPVLVTTQNERAAALAEFFVSRLLDRPGRSRTARVPLSEPWRKALRKYVEARTVCRRLEIHDMPSAVLFNIIKRAIEAGQRIARGGAPRPLKPDGGRPLLSVDERYQESWRIRLVIDDLSTIMNTYAQVREDSLFLPFLLYHLRREGTTSLIIDTRAGRPDDVVAEEAGFHTDLRALSDNRLYTWPVREFYGDHRVAIAAIPPIARDHRARVREVKRLDIEHGSGKGELFVDPVFELYAGLEEDRPQLVQLEVRLYGETQACCDYGAYLNEIFKRTFRPDAQRSGTPGEVVVNERTEDYNLVRDASYLKVDTRLDHTLLVQIDEFWRQGHAGGELERKYLMENVSSTQPAPQLEIRDPFHTYREARLGGNGVRSLKADFFDVPACDVSNPREDGVDRVPYLWDFGFMACRWDAWELAAAHDAGLHEFWRRYVESTGAATAVKRRRIRVRHADVPSRPLTWRWFLKHACDVADAETALRGRRVPAFDLAAPSAESFSCLVLEVWLSEILLTLHRYGNDAEAARLVAQLSRREWSARGRDRDKGRLGLIELLQPGARKSATGLDEGVLPGWSLELFKSWLLLVEALDLETLTHPGPRPGFAADGAPRETAVAVRHWYKTACAVPDEARAAVAPLHYGRLPGHFTTRGDWFLAVAPESRSYPLASRALDLLCSIRGNMRRLEQGVGLPTRRLTRRSESQRSGASFRSRLATETGALGTSKHLSYNDILALGARPEGSVAADADERLGWLWRSGLTFYHRHALTWQSWLFRTADDWARLKKAKGDRMGRAWRNGFDVYDEIDAAHGWEKLPKSVRSLESLQDFPAAIQALRDELWLVDSSISTADERSQPSGG